MMFRMSTRNSVTGLAARRDDERLQAEEKREDEDLEAAAARRLRRPRARLSRLRVRPRPQTARRRVRRARERAAPRSRRGRSGRETATVFRSAARVHASTVCASIITSTAMPRAQSMYVFRAESEGTDGIVNPVAVLADDLERRGEHDVLAHRVPDRAVLLVGQRDRARDRVVRHVALDGDVQIATLVIRCGWSSARVGDELRPQRTERMTPLRQDVRRRPSSCSRPARRRAPGPATARRGCRCRASSNACRWCASKTSACVQDRRATVGGLVTARSYASCVTVSAPGRSEPRAEGPAAAKRPP